jgi:peptide deformylase
MKIVTYPNPVLQKIADNVETPLNYSTKELIREMYKTVKGKGVGLAAPQVGASKQLCIIKLDRDMAEKKDKILEFVMINPKITFYSDMEVEMLEGCLSFPGDYYEIFRPSNIVVEFFTVDNFQAFIDNPKIEPVLKKKILQAGGWMSRVIQHEVDHLNAKLFVNMDGIKLKESELGDRKIID